MTVNTGEEEGAIKIAAFEKILSEKLESVMIVDMRDPDEYSAGTLKTAVNIPTDLLAEKIPTFPSDRPIIFICNTGAKSGEAFYMVQDLRPELKNVYYLDAECTYGKDGSHTFKKHE